MTEKIKKWLNENPGKLFLIDGTGAILSAILLGVVLVQLERFFGIPKSMLYLLALLPCIFAVYDFYCYYRVKNRLGQYLKGIAFLNLGYAGLSLALAFYHSDVITNVGWSYVLVEISIIVILASVELNVAKRHML